MICRKIPLANQTTEAKLQILKKQPQAQIEAKYENSKF